jgi:hypothetical protein
MRISQQTEVIRPAKQEADRNPPGIGACVETGKKSIVWSGCFVDGNARQSASPISWHSIEHDAFSIAKAL